MYAYILLSLLLAIVAADLAGAAPPPAPWAALAGAAVVSAGVFLAGLGLSGYILWRRDALARDETRFLRKVGRLGKAYRLLVVAAYAAILLELRWAAFANGVAGGSGWSVLALGLTLGPLVVLLGLAWTALYWADRRLRGLVLERAGAAVGQTWSLPRYLEFMGRQYLLVLLAPLLALVALHDAVSLWLGPPGPDHLGSVLLVAASVAGAAALSGPWVRLCWRTKPLPDGPLRRRLLALADRAWVRVADILVWRTNLSIANGCLIGPVGPLRYILITDALLLAMAPEEVEAVFAHEVAHVKYRHVPLYLALGVGGAGAALLAGELVAGVAPAFWETHRAWASALGLDLSLGDLVAVTMDAAVVGVVLLYWGLGFGLLSRRCELECDLYAARATDCPAGCSPPDGGFEARPPLPAAPAPAADAGPAPAAAPGADASPDAAPAPPAGPADPAEQGGAAPAGSVCEHRAAVFAGALRRIARLNGVAETARGWRHYSIARRCRFVQEVAGDPEAVARAERRFRRLRAGALVLAISLVVAAMVLVGSRVPSEADHPEDPAGPEDVPQREDTWITRLVDRHEVDRLALGPPEFDRDAHPAAHPDDGRPARLRGRAPPGDDDVAVPDARDHAVAVHAEGERAGRLGTETGQVHVLDDAVGRRRG